VGCRDEGVGAVGRPNANVSGLSRDDLIWDVGTYAAELREKTVSPLKALGKVLAEVELEEVALLESDDMEMIRASVSSRGRSLFVILPELPVQPLAIGLGARAALF